MARINLLPWREEQRQQKNKEFMTVIVMVILIAGAAALGTLFFFNAQLKEQEAANEIVIAENLKLDEALKEIESLEQRRSDIISRMKVIQDLQGKRPIPVRVWDDLSGAIPGALFLTAIERTENALVLTGRADNPNVVSLLINNLDASEWMGDSSVQSIEKPDSQSDRTSSESIYPEDRYVTFQLTTQIQFSTEEDENTDVVSNDTGGEE